MIVFCFHGFASANEVVCKVALVPGLHKHLLGIFLPSYLPLKAVSLGTADDYVDFSAFGFPSADAHQ